MARQGLEPQGSRLANFFRAPSTRLGWAAVAGSLGAIVLVILVNVLVKGSGPPAGNPWWWQLFGTSALVCLAAAGIAGLIAVLRRHERSWMVIVPTTLTLLIAVSELIQGLGALLE